MELDEISNGSTISNLSNIQNNSGFLFDTEEPIYPPNIEELVPEINNIITTANLGNNLHLKNIASKLKNIEYNFSKSSNLILRTKSSKITVTLFPCGKMICSGAKNEKESKATCLKIVKMIKKFENNVELKDFKIQNMVVSFDVKFKINLDKLFKELNLLINNSKKFGNNYNYCKYNKNEFQGLIFYMNDSTINFIIYESGKIVLSGAKNRKEIYDVFKNIYPLLIESKNVYNEEI